MRNSRKEDGDDAHEPEEQIRYAVQQAEADVGVAELCRKYGVAQARFYRWRQNYGTLTKSKLARLKDARTPTEAGQPRRRS